MDSNNKFKVGDMVCQTAPPQGWCTEFNVVGVHQVTSVGTFAITLKNKVYSYNPDRFALVEESTEEKNEYCVAVCEKTFHGHEMFKRIGNHTGHSCYKDAEEAAMQKLEDVGNTALTLAILKVCSRIVKAPPVTKPPYTVTVIR